jgi:hypothetical protein
MINRTITTAQPAIPADRSMRALEYAVALFAMAGAFFIGLAR